MFDELDTALGKLLDDSRLQILLPELYDAEISFLTPDKSFPYEKDTVDLFLYETKENRELREALPSTHIEQGVGARRRAPLRVDCSYMVTTWSKKKAVDKIAAEHLLLAQALNWLSRFPVVPLTYFSTGMQDSQEFMPPTMVAQMDGAKSAGEFWHALGIAPRPYFNLMVTLTMDLHQTVEDGIVTTIASRHHATDPQAVEERLIIGGTVRSAQQNPVADAWVRLEPRGDIAVTDALGRFVLQRAPRGGGNTLRARAAGQAAEATRANLQIPSPSGEYDLTFP